MKRLFDFFLSSSLIALAIFPMLLIALIIKFNSVGPVIHLSKRSRKKGADFLMPKFRTMKVDTPDVASHLLLEPESHFTTIGKLLRKYSLDELPQLFSILFGYMSFVGPRPALHNQTDLIRLRHNLGIDVLLPGLTGWAQVNGRDELSIEEKVQFDKEYLNKQSFLFDIYIIWLTFVKVIRKDGVSH